MTMPCRDAVRAGTLSVLATAGRGPASVGR
jgi:hypothetical protein